MSTTNITQNGPESNPDLSSEIPGTNCQSHGTTKRTEEDHNKRQSGQPVSWPSSEKLTSRISSRNAIHSKAKFGECLRYTYIIASMFVSGMVPESTDQMAEEARCRNGDSKTQTRRSRRSGWWGRIWQGRWRPWCQRKRRQTAETGTARRRTGATVRCMANWVSSLEEQLAGQRTVWRKSLHISEWLRDEELLRII